MEAKELMVGDLVYAYTFPNENPEVEDMYASRITTVSIDDGDDNPMPLCEGRIINTNGIFSRPIREIIAIPLTDEILQKNGLVGDTRHSFIYRKYGVYRIDVNCEIGKIEIYDDKGHDVCGYVCRSVNVSPFIYVHQLQHALRLCELYEMADNFKI